MEILQNNQFNTKYYILCYIYINGKGGFIMFKFLAKTAEKYAKATNTACLGIAIFHQPKMPASMIKKD